MENICQSKNRLNFYKISKKSSLKRATEGSAGMDLSACVEYKIEIKPGDIFKIPCGIAISIPAGYGAFIFARSGLAIKHGITLANAVGVVDSDYRGEICVGLCNVGNAPYVIEPGERIAQLVILKTELLPIFEVEKLDKTQRGAEGFGSTGK